MGYSRPAGSVYTHMRGGLGAGTVRPRSFRDVGQSRFGRHSREKGRLPFGLSSPRGTWERENMQYRPAITGCRVGFAVPPQFAIRKLLMLGWGRVIAIEPGLPERLQMVREAGCRRTPLDATIR